MLRNRRVNMKNTNANFRDNQHQRTRIRETTETLLPSPQLIQVQRNRYHQAYPLFSSQIYVISPINWANYVE